MPLPAPPDERFAPASARPDRRQRIVESPPSSVRKNPWLAMCRMLGASARVERVLARARAGEHGGVGKERLDRPPFFRGGGERREVARRGDVAALRRRTLRRLSEEWIGDHERPAAALARHLHPQQVAPAGQIGDGVVLDAVAAIGTDQRLERHQVQLTVRGDEQARRRPEPGNQRLPARAGRRRGRDARRRRASDRASACRQASIDRVDRRRGSEVEAARRRLVSDDIGGVMRRRRTSRWPPQPSD